MLAIVCVDKTKRMSQHYIIVVSEINLIKHLLTWHSTAKGKYDSFIADQKAIYL